MVAKKTNLETFGYWCPLERGLWSTWLIHSRPKMVPQVGKAEHLDTELGSIVVPPPFAPFGGPKYRPVDLLMQKRLLSRRGT